MKLRLIKETGYGRDSWAKFQQGEARALNVLIRLYNDSPKLSWTYRCADDLLKAIKEAARMMDWEKSIVEVE